MPGCRPFTLEEVRMLMGAFQGRDAARNRCMLVVGCNCGFRISEKLTLTVGDVFQRGRILTRVHVMRRFMKGKHRSRSVKLNQAARAALTVWLREMFNRGLVGEGMYLFQSQAGGNRPISQRQALRVILEAAERVGLEGRIGTHSMRKTFAWAVYEREKRLYAKDFTRELPIRVVMKALDHRSVDVAERYLGLDEAQVDEAVDELNIGLELFDHAV